MGEEVERGEKGGYREGVQMGYERGEKGLRKGAEIAHELMKHLQRLT